MLEGTLRTNASNYEIKEFCGGRANPFSCPGPCDRVNNKGDGDQVFHRRGRQLYEPNTLQKRWNAGTKPRKGDFGVVNVNTQGTPIVITGGAKALVVSEATRSIKGLIPEQQLFSLTRFFRSAILMTSQSRYD
jgi:hypothetical protein